MSAFRKYLSEGVVKRRNKAAKRQFLANVGRVALASERRAQGVTKSRGPRDQKKLKSRKTAEEVAAGRAVRQGKRTSGYERDAEVTDRIYNAGRKASVHANTHIIGNTLIEALKKFCWGDVILNELRGKYASKRYFDNERKGKRSDRKTYRGHIKFQAKRDDAQAEGKIAPPGRGYDDEPETNPNR